MFQFFFFLINLLEIISIYLLLLGAMLSTRSKFKSAVTILKGMGGGGGVLEAKPTAGQSFSVARKQTNSPVSVWAVKGSGLCSRFSLILQEGLHGALMWCWVGH